MPSVQDYYPGDFYSDTQQSLAWLFSRQSGQSGNWQANVNPTAFPASSSPGAQLVSTTPMLEECGLQSTEDLSNSEQITFSSIAMVPPAGQPLDTNTGPDGFPVDYSSVTLPTGSLFVPVFPVSGQQISAAYQAALAANPNGESICGTTYPVLPGMTIYGYVFNPVQPIADYRVDIFSITDAFYYQSSAPGTGAPTSGPCAGQAPKPSQFQSVLVQQGVSGYWAAQVAGGGLVIAALYPASVPQPAPGAHFPSLPIRWIAHTNSGIGPQLASYFGRIYSKTDIEYLQEDSIPIVIQDANHARLGSSVIPAPGSVSAHVLYRDPVYGPTLVYTSLASQSAFGDLPLSFVVPTSDPLYVPDPTTTNIGALQNRSYIYDCALAILVYSASGNFRAAARVIAQLNALLENPGYLPSLILENAEDGSRARWTGANGTVANVAASSMSPQEPPYGTGNVIQITAKAANASFTLTDAGLPDSTDSQLSFEHYEGGGNFQVDISVVTAAGKVTELQVNSNAAGAAAYNSAAHQITIPIGPGTSNWRVTLVPVQSLIASLAGDTLTSITGFKVTLVDSGMTMYLDNLSAGNPQPANSLTFSYDVFYGQIGEAYIRAGAMAWVCYAYCVYMTLSLDYTPALSLEAMINFLLTLRSQASDLTNGLFYLGYGAYANPGYQFVPGLQTRVSTEHQIDLYFAFMRAAGVLPVAAVGLSKTGTITRAQAQSLQNTAAQLSGVASTIATDVIGRLYIPPAGNTPGHFAQGVTGNALDASQALDASGTWAAMMAHAAGRDDIALQCIEFFHRNFLLNNQTIPLSNEANSWNEAYQQPNAFSGFKPYNDSPGGYSGSPLSVSQEGTWGAILALTQLSGVNGVSSYFQNLGTSIEGLLTTLVAGQRTVRATTGDGSLIGYSRAARGLPWEFEVWPMFAATAWFWLTAVCPGLLLTTSNTVTLLETLQIPTGAGQTANELEGTSSIGAMTVKCIDPRGTLKQLAAQDALIGKVVQFQMGFPSLSIGDFVTLHTLQITQVGWDSSGMMTLTCSDIQRFIQGQQIWWAGGPGEWSPGQTPAQPVGPAAGANGFPVSQDNPRFLQGNPVDILLAALQNELGVGQDPSLRKSNYVLSQLAPVYSQPQNYDPLPPPPGWAIFTPGDDSTLINPNAYIDVDQFLSVRDSQLSGDFFEFVITRPTEGKQFIEDQILKPLGLYLIVGADGKLRLKPLKPLPYQTPVFKLTASNIIGIPDTARQPVVNMVTARMDVDNSGPSTAARAYDGQLTYQQQTSLERYHQVYEQQVEATGVRTNYGATMRLWTLADRIFRRHSFAPPVYRVKTHLAALAVELGDLVSLTHPLLVDFQTGKRGVVNITCEVVERRPDYAQGRLEFSLLDTRFLNLATAYQIAPAAQNLPGWQQASAGERACYMFVSSAAEGGTNPDGTPGNTIY
ncbi:MAG TPA: hypothetical protein VGZ29_13760 [Terriglobia bacterium]|nr:hypothetical protein [Terriglobia bacterium]